MAISQIYDMSARQVWVGRYDEHGSREVAWDVSPWTSKLGSEGVFALLVTRPRDTDSPYNAQVSFDATTNLVTWAVTDIDTALKGWGRAELHYYVDGALVKSQTFVTIIEKAMFAGSTAPSAAESWVERMEQAALDAQAAAETAEDAEATATSAATTATSAAATAITAANSASSSASSARADATTATNAATAAALSESAASTSATNAAASAEAASTSALTASTAASTATTKASQASASASTAATAATTATTKASEATTAATTATTKAGEASTSASTATSAKDTAVSASQTATTKATEAATAAATATSAKTDAVAANTAAQSAKTAAQTAQTGAETAAASVSASAAQIATNAADISQLKSDLNYIAPVKDKTTNITNFPLGFFNNTTLYVGSGGYLAIVEMSDGATYKINTSGTYNRFSVGVGNSVASQSTMAYRYTGTASTSNEYTYTNSSNYKYMIVWLNSGTDNFDCSCHIREVVGNADELTLNGVSIYNKTQVDILADEKRDAQKYGTITNFLTNGDFHTAGLPLQYANCTGAVSDGVLTVTGNGDGDTIKSSYYYPISDVATNQYFIALWVKANSANCKSITLRTSAGYGVVTMVKPIQNKWYLLTAKYASTSGLTADTNLAYSVWATYADATAESGESISIKQAVGFMINTDFGIGTYPALYKLNNIIKYNGFWMGSKDVIVEIYPDPITKQFVQKQSFGQKRRPLVTFVDDDGWQRVYEEFSPISEEYGVPFVSSIQIGSTIQDWNALYLQDELGWEFAVHPDPSVEGGLASLETEEEIEQWMVDTNNHLNARGFKWQNVVYAHGEPDERVRRIAKKFYRCGACNSSPKVNRGVVANFEIQRIPIGYPMNSEWNTFANLKTFIDDAITHNGWCIFMTHAGMTNWHTAETTQIIEQLVNYCVNTVGVDVVTLNDGFNVFGNAVETGDFLGENARAGDDKTKGVAISQDGLLGNVIGRKSMDNLLSTLGQALDGTFTTTCDVDTGEYSYTFTPNS